MTPAPNGPQARQPPQGPPQLSQSEAPAAGSGPVRRARVALAGRELSARGACSGSSCPLPLCRCPEHANVDELSELAKLFDKNLSRTSTDTRKCGATEEGTGREQGQGLGARMSAMAWGGTGKLAD